MPGADNYEASLLRALQRATARAVSHTDYVAARNASADQMRVWLMISHRAAGRLATIAGLARVVSTYACWFWVRSHATVRSPPQSFTPESSRCCAAHAHLHLHLHSRCLGITRGR